MLLKTQWGKYINLDKVEALEASHDNRGQLVLWALMPDGRGYSLLNLKDRADAEAVLGTLTVALEDNAPVFDFQEYWDTVNPDIVEAEPDFYATREERRKMQGRRVYRDKKKNSGAALDWTPPEGKTYHLGKRAEEQPAAINFYPDNPQPSPAERRAAAEAQAAAVRAAYHRAHRKNAEQAEGKPSDWAETITAAEEAEIKAYNAQTTAENLDIIRCSYPASARGAIITQSGETITDPDCWDKIYAEATPEGSLAITLEGGLDALGEDPKDIIIGIYPEEQALRIYRDLRAQIEGGGDPVKIVMPD